MDINFLLQFLITPESKSKRPFMKLCKLVTNVLVNLPFLPRADFGRLLVCCLGAHNESFGAVGLTVSITSRYKYRMTRLQGLGKNKFARETSISFVMKASTEEINRE